MSSDHWPFAPNQPWDRGWQAGHPLQQILINTDCRGFTDVVGIGLEGKTKDGQAFAYVGTEKLLNHSASNAVLLPAIQLNDRFPVAGHIRKTEMPAEMQNYKDVFLEAAAPEARAQIR